MINNDRIVPITSIDFLSLIGTVMRLGNIAFDVLNSEGGDGNFIVSGTETYLADQPAKSIDFTAQGRVFFVADYDFAGITFNGEEPTYAEGALTVEDIKKDGITLYLASYASGEALFIDAATPDPDSASSSGSDEGGSGGGGTD